MHNGWKNYQTWTVFNWLENIAAIPGHETHRILEVASEINTAYDFTFWLKDYTEMRFLNWDKPSSGMAADLFSAAVAEIDWREIAEYYIKYVKDEASEDKTCTYCNENIRKMSPTATRWISRSSGDWCKINVVTMLHYPKKT